MNSVHTFAPRISAAARALDSVLQYFNWSFDRYAQPGINNFAFGNPQEMPLSGFVRALQRQIEPQDKDWFAYKMSEAPSRKAVSESLRAWRGIDFQPDDIVMTNGGFAALAVALNALAGAGDEVIFNSPPWFFYESLIYAVGAVPVRVKVRADNFDLDLEAIAAALTDKTRVIIVNSPNNPTGRIYPPQTLQALAALLTEKSERSGHPIYLLSDEAYSRIIFDGKAYYSPTQYYPYSLLIYTYGKVLLTPGQRIGYIALPPTMPERAQVNNALTTAQFLTGWSFPNALLQHALADLDKLSIDIEQLQAKRDTLVETFGRMGYDVHVPEGTFYLLPRSPLADDWKFIELLAEQNILALPGTVVEKPGYFRLSLTANEDMIERALPGFEKALQKAKSA